MHRVRWLLGSCGNLISACANSPPLLSNPGRHPGRSPAPLKSMVQVVCAGPPAWLVETDHVVLRRLLMALILGIDPGSRITGYGIIEATGNRLRYVACGCIRTTGESHPERLKAIYLGLGKIIEEFSPQECAIEEVFLGKSVSSALKL